MVQKRKKIERICKNCVFCIRNNEKAECEKWKQSIQEDWSGCIYYTQRKWVF